LHRFLQTAGTSLSEGRLERIRALVREQHDSLHYLFAAPAARPGKHPGGEKQCAEQGGAPRHRAAHVEPSGRAEDRVEQDEAAQPGQREAYREHHGLEPSDEHRLIITFYRITFFRLIWAAFHEDGLTSLFFVHQREKIFM
jgi:hypothetical protein